MNELMNDMISTKELQVQGIIISRKNTAEDSILANGFSNDYHLHHRRYYLPPDDGMCRSHED